MALIDDVRQSMKYFGDEIVGRLGSITDKQYVAIQDNLVDAITRLDRIEAKISNNAVPQQIPQQYRGARLSELSELLANLAANDEKIECIKIVRQISGCSLLEGKNFVELWQERLQKKSK